MFCEKDVLKISKNSEKNTCAGDTFPMQFQVLGMQLPATILKRDSSTDVPWEICGVFKNT